MNLDTLLFDRTSLLLNPVRALTRNMTQFEGSEAITRFSRIASETIDEVGELDWQCTIAPHQRGSALLSLSISGHFHLTCIECRQALRHNVQLASRLLWCRDAARAQALEDSGIEDEEKLEVITSDIGLMDDKTSDCIDLAALIEDEVLLNWPDKQRHAQCARTKNILASASMEETHRPFAELKKLLKKN